MPRERIGREAFNLGTGVGSSVREVIDEVRKISGREFLVKETSRRAGDPPELVADARRAKQVLGWTPEFSDLKTIVQTAWDSLQPR